MRCLTIAMIVPYVKFSKINLLKRKGPSLHAEKSQGEGRNAPEETGNGGELSKNYRK